MRDGGLGDGGGGGSGVRGAGGGGVRWEGEGVDADVVGGVGGIGLECHLQSTAC